MTSTGPLFVFLFLILVLTRIAHAGFLWPDDTLPLATAGQIELGKTLYRDVWFDKPPLVSWIDLLWNARPGVPLRVAGAVYVFLGCLAAWQFAREKWGPREGIAAACLLAFFLTFGLPSAVIPLAADMLLIVPHLAAVYLAWRGKPFWSGAVAGVGLCVNSKAVFVLAVCALWQWRQLPMLLAGFAAPNLVVIGWMALEGSVAGYYREVWQWGSIYAAHTFFANPFREGFLRTVNWLGFQAAAVLCAYAFYRHERGPDRWRFAIWTLIAFAGVTLGSRFFPRYYFLLLVPVVIAGARGLVLMPVNRWPVCLLIALLSVPLVRFGPRYILLGRDAIAGREPQWADLALDQDSRAVARKVLALRNSGDTLFVWGFRPEIFVYAGMPAATRYLESQPLSGVLADRHLFQSTAIAPEFTRQNREELAGAHPTFIVDGLGLLNPALAFPRNPDLQEEVARTRYSIVYRVRKNVE